MKNKKIWFACIAVAILVIAGGLFGWKHYKNKNNVVTVVPVERLNSDWAVDQEGSSGTVKSSLSQSIVPDSDKEIDKIYVKEGQQVKIGDKILSYTMAVERLELELKEYDLKEQEYSIKRAEKELANLKKGIVSGVTDSYGSVGSKTALLASISLRSQEGTTLGAEATTISETTTTAQPAETTTTAPEATTTAKPQDTTTADTSSATTTSKPTDTTTGTEGKTEVPVDNNPTSGTTSKSDKTTSATKNTESSTDISTDDTPSYTKAEINEMITSKESEIADLKIRLKEDQLEYDKMKKEVDDGTITAAVTGVVKTVNDPETAAEDGSPVVVIVSADEMYVQGVVDEYAYTTLQKGSSLTATSWDTGNVFTAKITEISAYPVSNANYYGVYSSNPNISYYPYTAVIEGDTEEIENGESVSITLDQGNMVSAEGGSLYLPLAYVRTEGNQSYVYMRGENGRLKKQIVVTGQTLYNSVIEVKSGLTMEDSIAFPYGTTVKEGARTEVSEEDTDIVY